MKLERIYRASPRGIGKNWGLGCYVCCADDDTILYNDCAFFVPSRETGEAIEQMISIGAWLDYRETEPNWIQVKIGACDAHLSNLQKLIELVELTRERADGPGINERMIEESKDA